VVFITSSYGLAKRRAGLGQPDEFYVSKVCVANGKPAILRRGLGTRPSSWCSPRTRAPAARSRSARWTPRTRDRFSLADAEVEELARYAMAIEKHYGRPWTSSGARRRGRQALHPPGASRDGEEPGDPQGRATRYRIGKRGDVLATGRAIGSKIGQGRVRVVGDVSQIGHVKDGDVLVTDMTDPNWSR
jgi:pyruvate,water dikinase